MKEEESEEGNDVAFIDQPAGDEPPSAGGAAESAPVFGGDGLGRKRSRRNTSRQLYRFEGSDEETEVEKDSASTNGDEEVGALLPPPRAMASPLREGASSEEDSVAEMDYMSEGSNLSVKDLPAEDSGGGCSSEELTEEECLSSASAFVPQRLPMVGSRSSCVAFQAPLRMFRLARNASTSPPSSTNSVGGFATGILKQRRRQLEASNDKPSDSSAGPTPPTTLNVKPAAATGESCSSDAGGCKYSKSPMSLPQFRDSAVSMWTASHAANCPTEDRSSSLVNLLLQPLPPNFDSETQLPPLDPDYKTLIRLNLWCVIDGHGGGSVATYASEVLLPHIAASVSRMLGCAIISRGTCTVNGQLRDAYALDLDGLIQTSDRSHGNPNSIHYRSPYERCESEEDNDLEGEGTNLSVVDETSAAVPRTTAQERKQLASLVKAQAAVASSASSVAPTVVQRRTSTYAASDLSGADASVSSVKTSVKTAASPANREALVGTHSPQEVAVITRAITESFLAVDEGWINSIDPVATHQTSCQNNGRWNSGACALVVFTVQRLDWTSVAEPDREKEARGPEKSRRNTSQNRDAARRRMLDYAARTKSASSMSTVSSTSSITTEEAINASGPESEITETEGEDDRAQDAAVRRRNPSRKSVRDSPFKKESLISAPGGCSCHCYRAHDAILYTAHVGDCRAVMLGSAPPRTIKVRNSSHQDTNDDDESSHHSSDETECLSSSDHDADSSEEEDIDMQREAASAASSTVATSTPSMTIATSGSTTSTTTASYMNFPRRVVRQKSSRRRASDDTAGPYIALPPLLKDDGPKTVEFDFETDISHREASSRRSIGRDPSVSSGSSSNDSFDLLPLVSLPPSTRPIDLTTDHSAYNPAEVTAVLRRCNNAPRAISAGVGGGIKRVAGSLAVTRALGDAYLKTPLLSFLPYKSHAPYITARPEVNCRPLVKESDKMLVLATDGVWERASGEDILRWVRNFYDERVAEAERRGNRRLNLPDKTSSNEDLTAHPSSAKTASLDAAESDLFERSEIDVPVGRKHARSLTEQPHSSARRSPSPPAKRRKRSQRVHGQGNQRITYNVADVIVRRVLNKVRRARNISSLLALMSLPQGRARRSKHDDITASVVDLSAFVS